VSHQQTLAGPVRWRPAGRRYWWGPDFSTVVDGSCVPSGGGLATPRAVHPSRHGLERPIPGRRLTPSPGRWWRSLDSPRSSVVTSGSLVARSWASTPLDSCRRVSIGGVRGPCRASSVLVHRCLRKLLLGTPLARSASPGASARPDSASAHRVRLLSILRRGPALISCGATTSCGSGGHP